MNIYMVFLLHLLSFIDLRWNYLGIVGGREILKTLSKNKNILKLDIADSEVPLEICKSIGEKIKILS